MTALSDDEDAPPHDRVASRELPTAPYSEAPEPFREPLPSQADTERPPPIDFSRTHDSRKLEWLCETVQHLVDGQLALQQNVAVLSARIGVLDGDDGGPSIYTHLHNINDALGPRAKGQRQIFPELRQLETAVGSISIDTERMRTHLLGKGASVVELVRHEERTSTVAAAAETDRPPR